jgi:hypothetical protein
VLGGAQGGAGGRVEGPQRVPRPGHRRALQGITGWARAVPDVIHVDIPFLRKGQIGGDVSAALFGVGYILGPRIAAIMVGGGTLAWVVIIPVIAWWGEGRTDAPVPGDHPASSPT